VVEELLPGTVAGLAEMDVDERIVSGFGRFLDQRHSCLFWGSASFFDVAVGAGADDIFPDRFAAHTAGDNVVERQLSSWVAFATILASIFVAGEDVSAVELDVVLRQTVIEQQPNNPRHRDIKVHGGDPIVAIGLELSAELAYLTPALEIIVGISAFFKRNHLGKLTKQQRKRPFGPHDSDGHVMLVEHKHITVQSGLIMRGNHNTVLPCRHLICETASPL